MKKVIEKYRGFKVSEIANLYGMKYSIIEVVPVEGVDEDGEYIWCGGTSDKMILFYKGDRNDYNSFIRCIYDSDYVELVACGEEVVLELNTIKDDYFIWCNFKEFDNELYINCKDDVFDKKYEIVLYEDEYSTEVILTEKEICSIKISTLDEKLKIKLELALKNIEHERNNN